MVYGYARVSSVGQEQNGNSLEDQRQKLIEAGAKEIFSEAFTGKTMDRPEFNKLLSALQPGDTLICCKLDRFSRTAAEGAKIIQELLRKGITVDILNMGRIDDSAMGRLMVTMLLAFAEFERSQIIERTQAGRRRAMERGVIMGRKEKFRPERMKSALDLLAAGNSYNEVAKMTGISKRTLIRHNNEAKARKLADV